MNMNFRLLLLLCIIIPALGACPAACLCSKSSTFCQICLPNYARVYNWTTLSCDCAPGYVEAVVVNDYCCPQYCWTCAPMIGCLTCRSSNWMLVNTSLTDFNCTCKPNYYFDSVSGDCLCMSNLNNGKYYSPSPSECYVCPNNATCNSTDCTIQSSVLVTITNIYSYNKCVCQNTSQYLDVTGQNCAMVNNSQPGQYYSFTCISPYTLVSGVCQCLLPYTMYNNSCICSSILSFNYYQVNNVCYTCLPTCSCTASTCQNCTINVAYSVAYYNSFKSSICTCANNSIYVNSNCTCNDPYASDCTCLNKLYPSLYYVNNGTCTRCPYGCLCDIRGCYQCSDSANRQIVNFTCNCLTNMIETNQTCVSCKDPFVLVNKTCTCPNNTANSLGFTSYSFNNTCTVCPLNCLCSQSQGCYSCNATTLRSIVNSSSLSTCNCVYPYQQVIPGAACVCSSNFVSNQVNGTTTCSCSSPYYKNSNNQCVCSSFTNSTLYTQTNGCILCPTGCLCQQSGCIYCNASTGRVVTQSNNTYFTCPCMTLDSTIFTLSTANNSCSWTCVNTSQYYLNYQCLSCSSRCLTCNITGCTSCINGTTLTVDQQCSCINSTNSSIYINDDLGTCRCITGYFYANNTCVACPSNCANCFESNGQTSAYTSLSFSCTSCKPSMYRSLDPSTNCSCIPYYNEGLMGIKQFCCHYSCLDCNINGCISCSNMTHRVLNSTNSSNVTCSCIGGMINDQNYNCVCPSNTYYILQQCAPCPIYCLTCILNAYFVSCTSCPPNRVAFNQTSITNTTYTICVCVNKFVQNTPQTAYCSPLYCTDLIPLATCSVCLVSRIPTSNGTVCSCAPQFYQDSFFICQPCVIGCLNCTNAANCTVCDNSRGYYKIVGGVTCFNEEINLAGYYRGLSKSLITFEFSDNYNVTGVNFATIQYLQLNPPTISDQYFNSQNQFVSGQNFSFPVLDYLQTDSKFVIYTYSPDSDFYLNTVIWLSLFVQPASLNDSASVDLYFLLNKQIYSDATLQPNLVASEGFSYLIIIFMAASLLVSLWGYKHNQIPFFLQTVYLLGFKIYDQKMELAPYLNYLRVCTLKLQEYMSPSPLDNVNPDWSVYTEYSTGNYQDLTFDANIIRNVGLAIFLLLQISLIGIVLRLFYHFAKKQQLIKPIIKKYKRTVYRLMQFMTKILIYPVIFFCIQTLSYYQEIQKSDFTNFCFGISAGLLLVYIINTILIFHYDHLSSMYKLDIMLQTSTNILAAIIVLFSYYTWTVIFLIMVFIVRGISHIYIRKRYEKMFQRIAYLKMFVVLLQIITIICVYVTRNVAFVLFMIFFVVFLNFITAGLIIRQEYFNYRYQSKLQKEQQELQKQKPIDFIGEEYIRPRQGFKIEAMKTIYAGSNIVA